MLFNSISFIFYFLPAALAGYYLLARIRIDFARAWLCAASLAFYAMWDARYLILLLGSIFFNYAVGLWIIKKDSLTALWVGIAANLAVLFYFKYLFSLIEFAHLSFGTGLTIDPILLPLGISFFTFTQLGYLVDCQAGLVTETNFVDYMIFVTFFPHLIAGPILHHKEIMPQFKKAETYQLRAENFSVGITVFIVGLAKKVLIADFLAPTAESGFSSVAALGVAATWVTALSYSLQLYFDFSGYSDMAVGIAKMFGVRFPMNFNSPYKATTIIDYWQRFHMTLTRYITLYIYNPIVLAVTRWRATHRMPVGNAALRTGSGFFSLMVVPLFVTMSLAGVWHGAGVQYLIFGLLHAFYLIANHGWRVFGPKKATSKTALGGALWTGLSVLLTYLCVVVAQVIFRADNLADGLHLLCTMFGWNSGPWLAAAPQPRQLLALVVLFIFVWSAPNIYNLLGPYNPTLTKVEPTRWDWIEWTPSMAWAAGIAGLFFISIALLQDTSRFLYFQF